MDPENSINLLFSRAKLPDSMSAVLERLQKASTVSVALFLVVSLLLGSFYFFGRSRFIPLVERRNREINRLTDLVVTETLLLATRERTQLIGKLIAGRIDWSAALDRIGTIAPFPALSSVSVDGKRQTVLTVETKTIEEIFPILTELITHVEEKKILSPQIVSFQMEKDGTAHLVVSFFPVL